MVIKLSLTVQCVSIILEETNHYTAQLCVNKVVSSLASDAETFALVLLLALLFLRCFSSTDSQLLAIRKIRQR